MNPQEALEIIVSMLNRCTLNPAERVGLQLSIRTLEQTVVEHAALKKEKKAEKEPEPMVAAQQAAADAEQANVRIDATPAADPKDPV